MDRQLPKKPPQDSVQDLSMLEQRWTISSTLVYETKDSTRKPFKSNSLQTVVFVPTLSWPTRLKNAS